MNTQWVITTKSLQTELTPGGSEEYKAVIVASNKKSDAEKTITVRTTATWLVPKLDSKDVNTAEAGKRFDELARKLVEVEIFKGKQLEDDYDLRNMFGEEQKVAQIYNQLHKELNKTKIIFTDKSRLF